MFVLMKSSWKIKVRAKGPFFFKAVYLEYNIKHKFNLLEWEFEQLGVAWLSQFGLVFEFDTLTFSEEEEIFVGRAPNKARIQ